METGIISVAYNGYGRFLAQWLKSIEALTIKPKEVVLVLGKDHGIKDLVFPNYVKVVHGGDETNLGKLKNLAMSHIKTEWVINLDFDDEILPWAIEQFSRFQSKDIIVSSYLFNEDKEKYLCMHPRINTEVLLSQDYYMNGKNYMHASSPFKRELWLKHRYKENECYNALFWIDCAAGGATFAHTEWPCLVYNKSKDGHSDIDAKERQRRFKIINNYREEKLK